MRKFNLMKRKCQAGIALVLCASFITSPYISMTAYAKGQVTTVITMDTESLSYDGENDYYNLTTKMDIITGSISNSANNVKSIRYKIEDEKGIVVKEGTMEAGADWSITDVGFALGKNTLTVTAETKTGSTSESFTIYNQSLENTAQMDVDSEDTDGDGLVNYWEEYFGTDATKADTDGDGLSDLFEITVLGSDPLVADSTGNGIVDGMEDTDGDGLTNAQEEALGTDPMSTDTDGDGLSDYDEVNKYNTDPANADSDNDGANDGWEIANGFDPLSRDKKFTVTAVSEDNKASVYSKKLVGSEAEKFTVEAAEDIYGLTKVPGAISAVYALGVDVKAELTVKYDTDSADANPAIYLYDIEKQKLIYLKSTVEDGYVTANTKDSKEGVYIVLDKTIYDPFKKSGNKVSTSTVDSNNDGISDEDTLLMCEGKLLSSTGEMVFGTATYEEVQANDDFDGDGLKNGEEVSVTVDTDGTRYVFVTSSPILVDTDGDGITDDKDTAPLERGLKDGIIGAVQIYSRHNDTEGFFLGHAFIVFTSYVDGQVITIDNMNRAYDYDEENDTYTLRDDNADSYSLNRGSYVSIGNYRSAGLDVAYDSLVNQDFEAAFEGSGLGEYLDFDNITMESLVEFVMSGNASTVGGSLLESMKGVSIRFNEEIYDTYAYEGFTQYPNAVLTQEITQEQLDEILAYDSEHNFYNLFTNNCSSIATGAWNEAFGDTLYAREESGIYSIFDTPMILKSHMLAREGVQSDVATFGVTVE